MTENVEKHNRSSFSRIFHADLLLVMEDFYITIGSFTEVKHLNTSSSAGDGDRVVLLG